MLYQVCLFIHLTHFKVDAVHGLQLYKSLCFRHVWYGWFVLKFTRVYVLVLWLVSVSLTFIFDHGCLYHILILAIRSITTRCIHIYMHQPSRDKTHNKHYFYSNCRFLRYTDNSAIENYICSTVKSLESGNPNLLGTISTLYISGILQYYVKPPLATFISHCSRKIQLTDFWKHLALLRCWNIFVFWHL